MPAPIATPDASPTVLSAEDLLALAVRARLLTEDEARQHISKLRRGTTAESVAEHLVKSGGLTQFQAKKLLTRQWQGLSIGRFRIRKPIGRGGMGMVYLAEDSAKPESRVALKILPPRKAAAEPRTRARFLREVAIGRELPSSANIARVHETGVVDGIAFIAMEFIPGRTVKSVVATHGAMTVSDAARVFSGVAEALAAAHEKGFIHRDVKPSNVMIQPDGTAKLVDFGFALRIGEVVTDSSVVGGAGYALGTFDFIPPEQAANAAAVTPHADQYSLGCSLYFALAGQPPFPGGTAKEKMQKHRWQDPLPLSTFRPDLPAEFAGLVEKLMAKAPADRFPSCRIAAKALATWVRNETPQTDFTEADDEPGEDDLDQIAPFNPAKTRHSRYRRRDSSPLTAMLLLIAVAMLFALGAYFALK